MEICVWIFAFHENSPYEGYTGYPNHDGYTGYPNQTAIRVGKYDFSYSVAPLLIPVFLNVDMYM